MDCFGIARTLQEVIFARRFVRYHAGRIHMVAAEVVQNAARLHPCPIWTRFVEDINEPDELGNYPILGQPLPQPSHPR